MTQPFNPLVVFTENDRFAEYARGRTECPISKATLFPVWNVLTYEDCVSVLRDPEHFGSSPEIAMARLQKQNKSAPGSIGMDFIYKNLPPFMQHMMVTADPPDHSRLRGLVTKAFTPRMIAQLEPRIAELADELLDAMQEKDTFDLMEDYAVPLPIYVIAEILGIDPSMRRQFKEWSNRMVLDPTGTIFTNAGASFDQSWVRDFTNYFESVFEERRRAPRNDLVSALVRLEDSGDRLSGPELIAMCGILLVAGNETTTNWLGNGLVALTQHPEALSDLEQDPALIPLALEEVLRYYSPVQCLFRFAKAGAQVRGQGIPEGEAVLVWLQSAHRDGQVFAKPDTFDIRRDPNPHIAFGSGIHFCLGAPLARLEAKIAMTKLLGRMHGITRATQKPVRFRKSIMLYGPERVDLVPGRKAA